MPASAAMTRRIPAVFPRAGLTNHGCRRIYQPGRYRVGPAVRGAGQAEPELGAAGRVGQRRDGTAVALHDPLADGQAQPAARVPFGTPAAAERVEDGAVLLVRDADALVHHVDAPAVVRLRGGVDPYPGRIARPRVLQ